MLPLREHDVSCGSVLFLRHQAGGLLSALRSAHGSGSPFSTSPRAPTYLMTNPRAKCVSHERAHWRGRAAGDGRLDVAALKCEFTRSAKARSSFWSWPPSTPLWKPLHGALPPGGAVGRLDRRRIAPVAGSPRDARTRTLAGLQCRDVVVLARLSRPGRGSSEHCDVEARGGLRDRADSEVCRGSVAAEKAVPDPGAGWERRWRALLMRSPSVPSRIRPTKRPSDTLRM